MRSSKDFNIITGEVLKHQESRSKSFMDLPKIGKESVGGSTRYRMPPLGTPKDKKMFQYSYLDHAERDQERNSVAFPNDKKSVLLNYTYEKRDPITHRRANSSVTTLNHKKFQSPLQEANMKGILTHHIDKNRLYAPNFHQNFPERVERHQFHKRNQICSSVADIEKSYLGKYFRKMK